jgi:hypothetical protein
MAATEGATTSTIQAATNLEDISKILWDVSPADTPLLSAMGRNKATATNHDWPTQELKAAAHLAAVEGEDAVPVVRDPRVRLSNHCQIIKDHAVSSGTQEQVLKAGSVGSEVARAIANIMREMKTHAEFSMIGRSEPKVARDATTAGELASLDCYLAGDSYQGVGTVPTGDGTDAPVAGTGRNLDEAIFTAALGDLWNQSGGNKNLLAVCGSKQRGIISTFTSSSTRYVSTDNRELTASIDVYDGDYHTVTVTPSRQCLATNVFIVDKEYLKCSDLRSLRTKDLAVIGDSTRKEVLWELTLEVCAPKAHSNIADLL